MMPKTIPASRRPARRRPRARLRAVVGVARRPAAARDARRPAQLQFSYAPVVKRVTPDGVSTSTPRASSGVQSNPLFDDPFFQRFFGQRGGQPARSLGSGVIVEASGLVVTNNHVIDGKTEVRVGALRPARVRRGDRAARSAHRSRRVAHQGRLGLPLPRDRDFGRPRSWRHRAGHRHPFGVGQTVTQGIVPGLARTQTGISDYGFFIQTDAAINPGNSGGALVDMTGGSSESTRHLLALGGSVGIGFAIPSDDGARGRRERAERRAHGASPVARGLAATTVEGHRGLAWPRTPRRRAVADVHAKSPADAAGAAARGHHHRGSTSSPSTTGGVRLSPRHAPRWARPPRYGPAQTQADHAERRHAPGARDAARAKRSSSRARSPFAGATVANYSPPWRGDGRRGVTEASSSRTWRDNSPRARSEPAEGRRGDGRQQRAHPAHEGPGRSRRHAPSACGG